MSEEILAKGRFRVDRRRALEKMERFQLADPRAYTLELVAAAVAAGATRIDIRNDSDDFELSWEGEGPTREEIDGIFDHLFARPDTARAQMLQHLAIGVLGALGQTPKWVRLDRGGSPPLRLQVDDPAETLSVEHAHGVIGTRIHVRQRITASNLAEALLLPLRAPEETRLLRTAARWCPVPLHLGGAALAAPTYPTARAAWSAPGQGALWLVAERGGQVDVVRRGVTVGSVERAIGALGVVGWWSGDTLALDASRGKVVEDTRWHTFLKALDGGVEALLGALAAPVPSDAPPDQDLAAAARWLAEQKRPLGRYASLALLTDLAGRAWTLTDLAAFDGQKGTLDDPALLEPGDDVVGFAAADRPLLDVLMPGLPDLTPALRTRAEGRARRRKGEAGKQTPEFRGEPHQATFTEGALRGAVRFRDPTDAADLLVHLRIDGATVEERTVASPAGTMEAILDHPGFVTDEGFRTVATDATYAAAEATLRAHAARFALSHIERSAGGASLQPPAMVVFTAAVRAAEARARDKLDALLTARPDDALLRAAAFTTGDRRRLTLAEVLAAEQVWVLTPSVPRGCPPSLSSSLLLVPAELVPGWLGWLGARARDGRTTLADEVNAAHKQAGPRRTATLDAAFSARTPFAADGFTGELGVDGSKRDPRVEILRGGVPVCTLTLPLGLPGLVGVLDHPALEVNRAHDGPAEANLAPRLTRLLLPRVDELARAQWDAVGEGLPTSLHRWLEARRDALPDWATRRPLVRTVAGAPLSIGDLRARASDRRAARIKLLPHAPGDVPGFEDAVVADEALARVLEAVAPKALRGAAPELADATRHLATYLDRSRAEETPALAARAEVDGAVRIRWVLPADADRIGVLRVEARWRQRVLTTRDRGQALGLLAIVEGDTITPSAALTELREPERLNPYLKSARARLEDLARDALDGLGEPPAIPTRTRAPLLALLARLDAAPDRTGGETTIRDRLAALPIFARLDGVLISRTAIAAAIDAGPLWTVAADTPAGPTDTDAYLLEDPWVLPALGPLAARIRPGSTLLAAWREGEARRRALSRREAVVTEPTLARASIATAGVSGEIALRRADAGPNALEIVPLVDGLPLDPVSVPFPAPAIAVVTGPAVRPDRAFRTWAAGSDPDAARAAIVVNAHTLARALLARVAPLSSDTLLSGDTLRDAQWAVTYALHDRGGPGGAVPLFPLLGGGTATADELQLRGTRIGFVRPGAPPFVAGVPPVVAPEWLHARLDATLCLVDLSHIALRHATPPPDPVARYAVVTTDAHVGYDGGADRVEIRRKGVVLVTLAAQGLLPIVGYIESPDADVDAEWLILLPEREPAVRRQLADRARAVLGAMMAEAEATPAQGNPERESALLAALDRATESARDDKALARLGADPVLARLLALPLFHDCTGARGSLLDVVARAPVRVVARGITGTPMPERGRVWALEAPERAIVGRLRKLQEAQDALRDETMGAARRAARRAPAPLPPDGARVERVALPRGEGAIWLVPPRKGTADVGVYVRIDGATAMVLAVAPGVRGWIEGPFDVDAAFERVRLDTESTVALRGAAITLLQAEAEGSPDRLAKRFAVALAVHRNDLDAVLEGQLSPWHHLPILTDTAGAPFAPRDIKSALKSYKRLVVGPAGALPSRKGERFILGDAERVALLRGWFPRATIEHVDEAAARKDEKHKDEAVKREVGAREKRDAALLDRAARLYTKWTSAPAPEPALAELFRAWAAGLRPGWPPVATADPEGPMPPLLAFVVATADVSGAEELELVARLAEALAAPAP